MNAYLCRADRDRHHHRVRRRRGRQRRAVARPRAATRAGSSSAWGWAIGVFAGVFVSQDCERRAPEPRGVGGPGAGRAVRLGPGPRLHRGADGGAFLGAVIVGLFYGEHFKATENTDLKLAVFCTAPNIRVIPRAFVLRGRRDVLPGVPGVPDLERQRDAARARRSDIGGRPDRASAAWARCRWRCWCWDSAWRWAGRRATPSTRPATWGRASRTPAAARHEARRRLVGYAWVPVVGPLVGAALAAGLARAIL